VLLLAPKAKVNSQKVEVFLSPETVEALKAEAKAKGTSVSGLLRMIALEYLNKK
jgi:hypothetical protein